MNAYQSDIETLPSYPASKLIVVNVLRTTNCVMSVTVYQIVSFLMYNIGVKQISSREESAQFATQLKLKQNRTASKMDRDYVDLAAPV